MSSHLPSFLATSSLAIACALLSIIVVLRRWAFVGEGIGHSSFGGAGTAWLLALLIPSLDKPWTPYVAVVIFCLGTAFLIGRTSRAGTVTSDVAVGAFLVASMAWGILAQQIYHQQTGKQPSAFEPLLFGRMGEVSPQFAVAAGAISLAVLLTIVGLSKEIIAYCFDPLTAGTSGVRTGFIHDLLMILLAVVIVIGARVVGSVLVVALLVLPGATALLLSRDLRIVILSSIAVSLLAALVGVTIGSHWQSIPTGPAIVLVLFVEFMGVNLVIAARGRRGSRQPG